MLSPREEQALCLLMRGLQNKQIAREMGIAEGTAKIHLKSIFRKLKVTNRVEAVLRGQEIGL